MAYLEENSLAHQDRYMDELVLACFWVVVR
jgi:hypothetical protein